MVRQPVVLGPDGLQLGATQLPLLSAALHYFQVPRQRWEKCLDAIAELGFPIVESFVPWSVHERPDGSLDFDGRGRSRGPRSGPAAPLRFEDGAADRHSRDLAGFLDACAARGLKVLLRPGPLVSAGLRGCGYPERILADERCLARGAAGNLAVLPLPPSAFAAPSYASARFLEEAQRWLDGVAGFLRGRCFPDGPVVALQVDNDSALFFRTAAYDLDYHPDAIALYRASLAARYPEGLPAGYAPGGASPPRIEELEPPRRFDAATREQLVVHLDWVAFKEAMVGRALRLLADKLRGAGLAGLPLLGSLPLTELGGGLLGLPSAEASLDAVGLDLYTRRGEHATVKRNLLRLAGSSRFPWVAELGWGGWPWWWARSVEDSRATALAALMHGARGFNLNMAVEREGWYGAPIDSEGVVRPESADLLRNLIKALTELGLPSLRRPAAVGLLRVREIERLASCASLLGPVPPAVTSLVGLGAEELCAAEVPGLGEGALAAWSRFQRAAERALDERQLAYCWVDADAAEEQLASCRLLFVFSLELAGRALLDRLRGFVARGGALLLGPRRPCWDERGEPLGELPAHRLIEDEAAVGAAIDEETVRAGIEPVVRSESAGVEVGAFFDPAQRLRCLFVASCKAGRVEASLTGAALEGQRGWDALTGAPLDLGKLALGAGEIRMVRLADATEGERS